MNDKDYTISDDTLGEIKIADDIFSAIAGLAVQDIDGVEEVAATVPGELAKKVGFKMPASGIKSTIVDGEVEIDMPIILKYGFSVLDVSGKVQEKVKNSIQNMTGFEVTSVNVKVAGVTAE